jgi:glycosyltransferase involved in cell wall biosynthesis
MACGTPVVASRTGGIPEVLTGFEAWLFEPGNESELAVKLNCLLDWRQQDPQLGDRCRNHVLSHFSLNTMVEGVERVLMQAMK